MRTRNIKVTTTNSFEGIEITDYLEPVTTHVVVGMNIFKDMLGGLTDIFGGKSETYQKTLANIDRDVIEQMKKIAILKGGNCVLGLRIDNDEISAQGKSMMMVTAIGTVAIANFDTKTELDEINNNYKILPNNILKILTTKRIYLNEYENDTLKYDSFYWSFIVENRVDDLLTATLNYTLKETSNYKANTEMFSHTIKYFIEYLLVIDRNKAIEVLFDRIRTIEAPNEISKLTEIIIKSKLVEYKKALELLKNDNFNIQKAALQLLKFEKPTYEKYDIEIITEILDLIPQIFKERGTRSTSKGILSGRESETWDCECGQSKGIKNSYCSRCSRDIFGFKQDEAKHTEILIKLENEFAILSDVIR